MADEENELEQPIINIGTYDGPRNEVGEREGRGRAVYANKDVYVGDFKAGLREGNGTYRWAFLGMKYKGEYKAGLRNGQGTMWYTNGTVYQGEWLNGKRHGQGRIEYPNLDVYEGQFADGLPSGQGQYYYFSCDAVVKGEFKYGRIVKGEMLLRDGSKWIGDFRLNQPYGAGEMICNGWSQKGEYVEINPPPKEEEPEGEGEEEKKEEEEEEDIEKDIQEEVDADAENIEKQKEEREKEEGEEKNEDAEGGEEGQEKEKPDPREKTLKALLPPKRSRKVLTTEIKEKLEKFRTLKLKWVPSGLPARIE